MERVKKLNRYQKFILLVLALMVVVFTALYIAATVRKGYVYREALLVPETADGGTVYTGRLKGSEARFTVSDDKTVLFEDRGKTYGPYAVREDPSALTFDRRAWKDVIGVEVRRGEELLFRGGYCPDPEEQRLVNEDGFPLNPIFIYSENGVMLDEDGNLVDPMEPDVLDLVRLAEGPELTYRGNWLLWFCGVLMCAVTAVSILYAYELFRFQMSFRIRNADRAEPSDWEIDCWYISWTLIPLMSLIVFIMGLNM